MIRREDIVSFWSLLNRPTTDGLWVHPEDERFFGNTRHSFDLRFPVSPYIGNILDADVIILGANAGFDPIITPSEFPSQDIIEAYVARVHDPRAASWDFVSEYYHTTNYGAALAEGRAALVNASPYRSKKISEEPENRALIENLPSTRFNRNWLREAIFPLAATGSVRVAAKRYGLWKMTPEEKSAPGIYVDTAPVSPRLTSAALAALQK